MSALTATELGDPVHARTRDLVVSEIFGPTFQGEGPSLGRRCGFVRLGGCNLACRWCDTPYTWDWTGKNGRKYDPKVELRRMTPDEVWERFSAMATDMVVVTGGEPLLQQSQLLPLLLICRVNRVRIEVETAGTVAPTQELAELVDQFNVSPKLDNSGNQRNERYKPAALAALQASGKAIWKFVATCPEDLDEVDGLARAHDLRPIYVMPEGITPEAVTAGSQELAQAVLERDWNLTTRLHILVYGNKRGV